MIQGFCHYCQIFLETEQDYCSHCYEKLEVISVLSENGSVPQNAAETLPPTPEIVLGNAEYDLPTDTAPTETHTQPAPQSNFSEPVTQATPVADPAFGFYKPTPTKDLELTNLKNTNAKPSSLTKPAIITLVVFVALGTFCTYSRSYFAAKPGEMMQKYDAARLGKPAPAGESATQNPWFWSFFRSEPTADEIFEHFEETTFIKNKPLASTSHFIKGTMRFGSAATDIERAYVEMRGMGNNSLPISSRVNGFADVNTDFEMSIKLPDKVFLKMEMTPTVTSSNQNKMIAFVGTDGSETWSFVNSFINGSTKREESNKKERLPVLDNKEQYLNPTFKREMYQSLKLVTTETIGGRKNYFVQATKPNGDLESLYFDIETGLVTKHSGKQGDVYIVNYSMIGEVLMPAVMIQKVKNETLLINLTDYKTDVPFDDSIFQKATYQ